MKKEPTTDKDEQKAGAAAATADQAGKTGKGKEEAKKKESAAKPKPTPTAAPLGEADTPMTEAAAADGGATNAAAAAGDAGRKRFSDQLTVFVSSLSFDVIEEDLREVFAPCGSLKEVN